MGVLLVAFFIIAPRRDVQGSVPQFAPSPASYRVNILSDSQFVLGPSARRFDLAAYLSRTGSPLLADAPVIEQWSAYASVNPQVVLAVLEVDGRVSRGWPASFSSAERARLIETLVIRLAEKYYWHLYKYGGRAPHPSSAPLLISLADGNTAELISVSSGTFAVLDLLGRERTEAGFARLVEASDPASFAATWARLFPETDALDASVSITPAALPPIDFFQFPFPLGQAWWFNGAHNWNGSAVTFGRPYSSMDFFTSADSCSLPPVGEWAVAAAGGSGYHPSGYNCWYRIDHVGGWTTSYYHLRNTAASGPVSANSAIGTIACEICAGGFATGPHVHFSLLYNGAYVDLEGVRLSGWTVRSGNGDYQSGGLEREGTFLKPYSLVLNQGAPVVSTTPTPTRTPTATATAAFTSTPVPRVTPSATPAVASARYVYPPTGGLIRSCPVELVAEVSGPRPAAMVRFWATIGGVRHQVGSDSNSADGWQTLWDCQGEADSAAVLTLTVDDAAGREIIAAASPTQVSIRKDCPDETYRTAFFANPALEFAPASSWCKASGVSYSWGTASPGAGVAGSDNFSARFRGRFWFDAAAYRFSGSSDDGVRVWVDRVLFVDRWRRHDQGAEPFAFVRVMASGAREVWVEYYEATGTASVALRWEKTGVPRSTVFLPLTQQRAR